MQFIFLDRRDLVQENDIQDSVLEDLQKQVVQLGPMELAIVIVDTTHENAKALQKNYFPDRGKVAVLNLSTLPGES